MDLMKTIHDDDEVPDLSENSDSEDEAQPKKNRVARRTKKDFETGFNFVSSQKEYMTDTWNDLSKYIKKQAKTNLDDKIAQVRQERAGKKATGSGGKESAITLKDSESESDESLSDDEMVRDNIKVGLTICIVLAEKSRTVQEIGWLETKLIFMKEPDPVGQKAWRIWNIERKLEHQNVSRFPACRRLLR